MAWEAVLPCGRVLPVELDFLLDAGTLNTMHNRLPQLVQQGIVSLRPKYCLRRKRVLVTVQGRLQGGGCCHSTSAKYGMGSETTETDEEEDSKNQSAIHDEDHENLQGSGATTIAAQVARYCSFLDNALVTEKPSRPTVCEACLWLWNLDLTAEPAPGPLLLQFAKMCVNRKGIPPQPALESHLSNTLLRLLSQVQFHAMLSSQAGELTGRLSQAESLELSALAEQGIAECKKQLDIHPLSAFRSNMICQFSGVLALLDPEIQSRLGKNDLYHLLKMDVLGDRAPNYFLGPAIDSSARVLTDTNLCSSDGFEIALAIFVICEEIRRTKSEQKALERLYRLQEYASTNLKNSMWRRILVKEFHSIIECTPFLRVAMRALCEEDHPYSCLTSLLHARRQDVRSAAAEALIIMAGEKLYRKLSPIVKQEEEESQKKVALHAGSVVTPGGSSSRPKRVTFALHPALGSAWEQVKERASVALADCYKKQRPGSHLRTIIENAEIFFAWPELLPTVEWHNRRSILLGDAAAWKKQESFCGACRAGLRRQVNVLLEEGALLEGSVDSSGTPPLVAAAWEGHVDVVRDLLEAGAQVGAKRKKNNATALWSACYKGHVEVVQLLCKAKADPNMHPPGKPSCYELAVNSGNQALLDALPRKYVTQMQAQQRKAKLAMDKRQALMSLENAQATLPLSSSSGKSGASGANGESSSGAPPTSLDSVVPNSSFSSMNGKPYPSAL